MTKEQIAELRKFYDEAPEKLTAWFGSSAESERTFRYVNACAAVMPRLLDEREVLLDAVRRARSHCIGHGKDPLYLKWEEALKVMDAAIAKAESP